MRWRICLTLLLIVLLTPVSFTGQTPPADKPQTAPVGGVFTLFTVYDGQTLRKGEFTFSEAYRKYDADEQLRPAITSIYLDEYLLNAGPASDFTFRAMRSGRPGNTPACSRRGR
jgi:hypothetical protein